MSKIKIVSNPYKKEIKFLSFNNSSGQWEDLKITEPNSKLLESDPEDFLPYVIDDILNDIKEEYYVGKDKVEVYFEGTNDEYLELAEICEEKHSEDIVLQKSESFLENGRDILKSTKENFNTVKPIIEKFIDSEDVRKKLAKVTDAMDDMIPICVFGNYSSGKSSFINSLIGHEILACGGTVVTAKVYRIQQSEFEDRARIEFKFQDNDVILSFEDINFRVLKGENKLVDSIKEAIDTNEEKDMYSYVKLALEKINNYEKKAQEHYDISNIISVEIPFSKKGFLGMSKNKFVIFDTPGSNSKSHTEHTKVLEEALDGFSNGIPVWVSTYDNLDTTDNAELCDKILNIDALDKRFTMIVCNKADSADLEGDKLPDKQIEEIKEYESVEKLYASGIYFVSSIMGIGSKTDGKLVEPHYKKTFHQQRAAYEDPEDEYYISLYKFNIMPDLMKKQIVAEGEDAQNIIYANSGLQSIESNMEQFASHYAAYNKCQMVYLFINEVVDEVNKKINNRADILKKSKEERTNRLEEGKANLIDEISKTISKMTSKFEKDSKEYVSDISGETDKYEHSLEGIEKLTVDIRNDKANDMHRDSQSQELKDAQNKAVNHIREYGSELKEAFFKGRFKEGFDKLSKGIDDLKENAKEVQDKQNQMKDVDAEIDRSTSDAVMDCVTKDYKKNLSEAYREIDEKLKNHWLKEANTLRDEIIKIIKDTESLTNDQRTEMEDIIMRYEPLQFNDDSGEVFIKQKFLQGHIFGLQVFESEKLNNKKLTDIYNKKIKENVKEISKSINENCIGSFKIWEGNLNNRIEQNITDYNPKLKDLSDMIREEAEEITALEKDQMTIKQSLEAIESLMAVKTIG